MKILFYFLYGSRSEYELEATFSILSALRLGSAGEEKVKIVVLTDRASFMDGFPIERLALTREAMAEWTQRGIYEHRAKICAFLSVLQQYGAPVTFVDTDTYFMADPAKLFERISPGHSLMHSSDGYPLDGSPLWLPVIPHLDTLQREGIQMDRGTEMLNSGVIGVDPRDAVLVERALPILDRLREIAPIFNMEQFAVTLGLCTGSQINRCSDLVNHYWGVRRRFIRLRIQRFLEANRFATPDEIIAGSGTVDLDFPPQSIGDRILTRIIGWRRDWSPNYRYSYLCYRSALANGESDPEVANLWIDTALFMLKQWSTDPGCDFGRLAASIQHDFPAMRRGKIDQLAWLTNSSKEAWRLAWHTESASNGAG